MFGLLLHPVAVHVPVTLLIGGVLLDLAAMQPQHSTWRTVALIGGLLLASLLLFLVSWVLLRLIRMNVKNRNWAGYSACICGLLFALPHYWFGLGVSFGYPGDFKATPDSFWSYWVVGTVAVVASVLGLSFVYPWGDKLPRWFKLTYAWVGCVFLSLWGFGFFVMQFLYAIGRVVPAPAFAEADAHPMVVWGYFWYPLFLGWGISLGLAALTESKHRPGSPQRT